MKMCMLEVVVSECRRVLRSAALMKNQNFLSAGYIKSVHLLNFLFHTKLDARASQISYEFDVNYFLKIIFLHFLSN